MVRCRRIPGWILIAVFSVLLCPFRSYTQEADTVKKAEKHAADSAFISKHSPKKAAIFALVLPGLGQAYNHKYWKMPIVYAGFGTMYYFVKFNTDNYHDFRDAYSFVLSGSTGTPPNKLVNTYNESQLLEGREYYRRNLELSYIITGGWYILQALDAVVDAHFFDYDVTDDLSLHMAPWTPPPVAGIRPAGGITLSLRF